MGKLPRSRLLQTIRNFRGEDRLSVLAREERQEDRDGLPDNGPGPGRAVDEAVSWLCRAQDCSTSQDGGVARHFDLIHGWGPSYPETTGYIVPTMLAHALLREDPRLRERADTMLRWLISIQLPDGSFPGGVVGASPVVGVAFNTGQILLGLTAGVRVFGAGYREALRAAARWLIHMQDPDGCWRKTPKPFALPGDSAYDTHIAWGLLEAARVDPDPKLVDAAFKNVTWALASQHPNGWFDKCCISDVSKPLTHTFGYVLRGVLEAYRYTEEKRLLESARRTANGLLSALRPDGFLPGRLDSKWHRAARWACLTGTVQIAYCWLMLYTYTGEEKYREAAYCANHFVRRTLRVDGRPEIRGGVKGSFPVDGGYGTYQYLSWACKFFIDSHLLEQRIRCATEPLHSNDLDILALAEHFRNSSVLN